MKKSILVVYNPQKKDVEEVLKLLKKRLNKYDLKFCSSLKVTKEICVGDLLITVGGDGTLLKVGHYATENSVPVLGINLGRLGYLAEFKINEVFSVIDKFFSSEITPQKRNVLKIEFKNKFYYAINDCVIRTLSAKVCSIELVIEYKKIVEIIGDGIIVATPTGSTAYSLASGGSIVEPETEVLLITPISPHTLSMRPIVISSNKKIELYIPEFKSNKDLLLSLDGQRDFKLRQTDKVIISSSEKKIVIHFKS
jgi:NAD+ kinase